MLFLAVNESHVQSIIGGQRKNRIWECRQKKVTAPTPGSFSLVLLENTHQRFVFPFLPTRTIPMPMQCPLYLHPQAFAGAATYGGAITYGMDDCGGALPNWAIYDLGLGDCWSLRWRYGFFSALPRTFFYEKLPTGTLLWDLEWVMIL